jgi:prenyltransferase beta subunit
MRQLLALGGIAGWFTLLSLSGQPAQLDQKDREATIRWILQQQVDRGGFLLKPHPPNLDVIPQPSLRATSGAVRALLYLRAPIPNVDRHRQFVLSCYDPQSGGFAEPGGQPDVTLTSVGIMAAVALQIPPQEYARSWEYLQRHAKSFEEVRIAAAAVEAAGVKNCPFDIRPWIAQGHKAAEQALQRNPAQGGARDLGSAVALILRLGGDVTSEQNQRYTQFLRQGQRPDGGWGKSDSEHSDLESTYRVMRAFVHLRSKPRDIPALSRFLAAQRSPQGAYAVAPAEAPSMSGTYYAAAMLHWLERWENPSKN